MKRNPFRCVLSVLLAVMLACTFAFVGSPALAIADETDGPLAVGAQQQLTATVSIEVVGEDGVAVNWVSPTSTPAGIDALTATQQVLDAAGLTYDIQWGSFLNSITSADGVTLETAADYSTYWQFLINGAYANVGASSYILSVGDVITWHFGASGEATNPAGPDYDTQTVPEDIMAEWAQFEDGGNVTYQTTPTEVTEAWRTRVGGTSGVSELVIADGSVFAAVGSSWDPSAGLSQYAMQLVKIDAETGAIVATTPLAGDINYTCRPLIANGLIYIPLDGGAVQAVNVSTMKTYWVSAAAADGGQATTSLHIHMVEAPTGEYGDDGTPVMDFRELLFVGTAVFDFDTFDYTQGSLRAIDAYTGTVCDEWTYNNPTAGFYWTNTLELFGRIIVADYAGNVHVLEAGDYNGAHELGVLSLGDRVVSDLMQYDVDVLVTTGDGTLWRIAVSDEGVPSVVSSVKAVSNCKSGPVVVGDKALVAGVTEDDSAAAVAVVDLATMTVEQVISTADGENLPMGFGNGVCAPVLASVQDEDAAICYFTINYAVNDPDDPSYSTYLEGGNVYWFRLGEDEAHLLYAPEADAAQYCDSPLIVDYSSNLYYLNDSGFIVKLVADTDDPAPVWPWSLIDWSAIDWSAFNLSNLDWSKIMEYLLPGSAASEAGANQPSNNAPANTTPNTNAQGGAQNNGPANNGQGGTQNNAQGGTQGGTQNNAPAGNTQGGTQNNAPAGNTQGNNGPTQRGGQTVPATGDATASATTIVVLAAVALGAAGALRRKEN